MDEQIKTDKVDSIEDEPIRQSTDEFMEKWRLGLQSADKSDEEERRAYTNNNYIVVNGNDQQNLVINLGEIQGDVGQNMQKTNCQNNIRTSSESRGYLKADASNLQEFLNIYESTNTLKIMLALMMLESIPEIILYEILYEWEQNEEEMTMVLAVSESMDDMINAISAKRMIYMERGNREGLPTKYIIFSDSNTPKNLRAYVWKNLIALREHLVKWLFRIRMMKSVRSRISNQVGQAFLNLAALDFSYAYEMMIMPLSKLEHIDDQKYLVNVLSGCIKIPEYEQSVDSLLCEWIGYSNKRLWQVAYRMYDNTKPYQYIQKLEKRLDSEMAREQMRVLYTNWKPWSGYFYPAYRNRVLEKLLLEMVATRFASSKTYQDKQDAAIYVCVLFQQDYRCEGYPDFQMLIIKGFQDKELKAVLTPVMIFIWEHKVYRDMLELVLREHLHELEREMKQWDYMKPFLLSLAFTGRESDYNSMIRFLEKENGRREFLGSPISLQIKSWLCKVLESRR